MWWRTGTSIIRTRGWRISSVRTTSSRHQSKVGDAWCQNKLLVGRWYLYFKSHFVENVNTLPKWLHSYTRKSNRENKNFSFPLFCKLNRGLTRVNSNRPWSQITKFIQYNIFKVCMWAKERTSDSRINWNCGVSTCKEPILFSFGYLQATLQTTCTQTHLWCCLSLNYC